jgi:hypothetical protein
VKKGESGKQLRIQVGYDTGAETVATHISKTVLWNRNRRNRNSSLVEPQPDPETDLEPDLDPGRTK